MPIDRDKEFLEYVITVYQYIAHLAQNNAKEVKNQECEDIRLQSMTQ